MYKQYSSSCKIILVVNHNTSIFVMMVAETLQLNTIQCLKNSKKPLRKYNKPKNKYSKTNSLDRSMKDQAKFLKNGIQSCFKCSSYATK